MKKLAVITGASSGIGKETAIGLAKLGFKLILVNRNSQKSEDALKDIIDKSGNSEISMIYADLSCKADIEQATTKILESVDKIDVLINNAGVYKSQLELNDDGIEFNVAVNYLAPKYMSEYLLPLIKKAEQGRIINLSSLMHKFGKVREDLLTTPKKYSGFRQYADTKLAVKKYSKELAESIQDTNVTVNSLHPGVIASDVFRDYPKWFNKLFHLFLVDAKNGAKPSINLATNPELSKVSGVYFNKTKQA